MTDKERIELENELLDQLAGKIFLLQDPAHKREIIAEFLHKVTASPAYKKFRGELDSPAEEEAFISRFMSYGVIDEFMADPMVEDIMINFLSPIFIHTGKEGLVKTERRFTSKEEIDLFIKKLIVFSGRTALKKINNLELAEIRGRVNIVHSPFGPQITITRAKEKPLSIVELVQSGALTPEIAAQFWLYVEGMGIKPANLIIAGGPGSGKTTLMNALFSFIPTTERMVVIEDTLELNTDLKENCSRLESDETMSLADLVKNSLRMRPDRIIVGEVRGREAQDLMTAMNIGKYCMGTIHASTSREAIIRLTNEPMNVPDVLVSLVDVFVIMRRFSHEGKVQRVVGELVETAGMEQGKVLLSLLRHYDFSRTVFAETAVSSIYRDRLAEVSGRTPRQIMEEISQRARIMHALVDKNINDYFEVTNLCRRYVTDPQGVIKELGLES